MPSSCVWDSTRRTMKKILMGVATLATLALSLTACGADPNAADAPEAVADGDSSEILIGGSLNLDGEQSAYDALILEGIRSEEHTSELQSRGHLVCRLLLEKKQ